MDNLCSAWITLKRLFNLPLRRASVLSSLAVFLACLTVAACDGSSDVEEEGGVVGTGIMLRGTASENKAFASNQIDIKAQSGQRSTGMLFAGNRYQADSVDGQGPWLVRSNLGDGNYHYGIAYSDENANIHSYSDVLLRSWFVQRSSDIDTAFDSEDVLTALPDRAQYLASAERFFALFRLVLDNYEVSGEQLLMGDFDADNTGPDRFLDSNPVIVEGNTITVLLTDPITQTQSTTRSVLGLDTDLTAPDTETPRAPGNVRVLGSASDQIVIVWEPAEDNVSVAYYQVYRDGVLLVPSPYPVFTDTMLQAATQYSYAIEAVDLAGNVSDRSVEVRGSTLDNPDTQAPPAPTALTITQATADRVDLIWGQSDIADVISFDIYRGSTPQSLQLLLKVTSTVVTDATVSGGLTYCYQIAANDAAGNQSNRSDVLCVETTGQQGEPPIAGEGVPALAGLNLPDTLSMPCTIELPATVISQNTILSEPCYLVQQDVVLDKFVNLTVSAGTVLKFAAGTRLLIGEGASLTSNGLPELPVVFTGQQPLPGFWAGVEFNRSNHPSNLIRNTAIEYAGGGELNAGLSVLSSVGQKSRIRVENSLFRFSARYGVSFSSLGTILDAFDGNLVTENNWPAAINLETLGAFTGNNDFTGNDRELIDVPRLGTEKDILIPDIGIPYRSGGMDLQRSVLTVEAGVELQLLTDSRITVDGEILAQGTNDKPITFTTWSQRIPGEWVGIVLSNSRRSVMDFTTIEFAGGLNDTGVPESQSAAIKLLCTEDFPAALSISESNIASSAAWGIYLDESGCDLQLGQNVRFIANTLGDVNSQ